MIATEATSADIVAAVLRAADVFTLPTDRESWPVYAGFFPDDPDEAAGVLNTTPIKDGRYQGTGETILHPGVQLLVRGTTDARAGAKVAAAVNAMDAALREAVEIGDESFVLQAATLRSGPVALGQEPERRRFLYSVNWTVSLKQDS